MNAKWKHGGCVSFIRTNPEIIVIDHSLTELKVCVQNTKQHQAENQET